MDTKLTLKLDQEVIEKAKRFAHNQHTSLSQLIENYLVNLTHEEGQTRSVSPIVKSLSGIIDLADTSGTREGYRNHLRRKYS